MNRLKLLLFLIITIVFVESQELDENFLDSLPDDIKQDILQRSDIKEDSVDTNYSSYRYSSKVPQSEDLVNLKKRLEQDLLEREKGLLAMII